jgi:hypothetical protein
MIHLQIQPISDSYPDAREYQTSPHGQVKLLAAVVNTTVVAGENLTVGSTVWLPAESLAPGR